MKDFDYIKVYVVDLSTVKRKRPFLYLQWIDPETGDRVTVSSKCKTRRDAEKAATAKEKELNDPDRPADGSMPWGDIEGKTPEQTIAGFKTLHTEQVLTGVADKTRQKVSGIFNSLDLYAKEDSRPLSRLRDLNSQFLSGYVAWRRTNSKSESTIQSDLRHLRGILNWAVEQKYLPATPSIPATPRASKRKMMKGRAITEQEFEHYIRFIPANVDSGQADNWTQMAMGIWLSSLRLDEAMQLSWDTGTSFHVMMEEMPKLRIPEEYDKGHEDRIYPTTPDFAEFLHAIPEAKRVGFVFQPTYVNHRNGKIERYKNSSDVSRVFSAIGEAAEIVVNVAKRTKKKKFVSAHDFRRSFGTRWSRLVSSFVLKELMRHATIQTTEAFYIGDNANETQKEVWEAWKRKQQ